MILLAVTGLAMNHEEDLEFLKGTVRWEAVLDLYGLEPEEGWIHFQAGQYSCASLERGIYVDGHYLTATESPLVGVVRYQRLLVDSEPTLEGDRPQIVDQLDSASLPGALLRVGRDARQQLIVETDAGHFRAGDDLLEWHNLDAVDVDWSETSDPSADQRAAILREYRGEGLPLTRVVADLHSGRIFGRYGPLLMDASAVVLLLLVVTGIMGSGFGRRRRGGD